LTQIAIPVKIISVRDAMLDFIWKMEYAGLVLACVLNVAIQPFVQSADRTIHILIQQKNANVSLDSNSKTLV
jgi:hypothetical protein